MRKPITIDEIQEDDKAVVILSDEGGRYQTKYRIWKTDQDGKETRAYQQFLNLNPVVGDSFDFDVYEYQYKNQKSGKMATGRTINFFYVDAYGTPMASRPVQSVQPTVPSTQPDKLQRHEERLNELTKTINLIMKGVKSIKDDVEGLKGLVLKPENEKEFEFNRGTPEDVPSPDEPSQEELDRIFGPSDKTETDDAENIPDDEIRAEDIVK